MSSALTQTTMALAKLTRLYATASGHTWAEERTWLETRHPRRMARLRREIAAQGIEDPIRLCRGNPACGPEWHVVDGHHRVVIAEDLGITRVPVGGAWTDTEWMYYADDNPGDDPV